LALDAFSLSFCGMSRWPHFAVALVVVALKSRRCLLLKSIALRHSLLVFTRKAKDLAGTNSSGLTGESLISHRHAAPKVGTMPTGKPSSIQVTHEGITLQTSQNWSAGELVISIKYLFVFAAGQPLRIPLDVTA
jgi:hypothetical protein